MLTVGTTTGSPGDYFQSPWAYTYHPCGYTFPNYSEGAARVFAETFKAIIGRHQDPRPKDEMDRVYADALDRAHAATNRYLQVMGVR